MMSGLPSHGVPDPLVDALDVYFFEKLSREVAEWAGFCSDMVSTAYDFVVVFLAALVSLRDSDLHPPVHASDPHERLDFLDPYLSEVRKRAPIVAHELYESQNFSDDQYLSVWMESLFRWMEQTSDTMTREDAVADREWWNAIPAWIQPSVDEYLRGEWNEQKNTRRCVLIDKDIDDEVSATEAVELSFLQCALERHLDSVAPMPFENLEQMRNLLSNPHTEDTHETLDD